MRINAIKYSIIDSLKSLKRNSRISTAAAATVAATLFILGIFFLTVLNVNRGILSVELKGDGKVSSSLMIMQPINPQYVVTNILVLFLISGTAIGSLGSIISIRKFLHV